MKEDAALESSTPPEVIEPLLSQLRGIDLNAMTPLDAFDLVRRLHESIKRS